MHRKSRYKNFIIGLLSFLSFVLFTNHSSAQNILNGQIFENNSHRPIAGVKVENLKSHITAVSTTDGKFSIKAVKGDLIVYSRSPYKPDTVLVANLKHKEIYLDFDQTLLKEVKIMNKETNLGTLATPVATPFGGNTVRYQTDANGNNKGGLKIMIPGSDQEQQKKIKEAKREADGETASQIAKIFSPQNLQNYVPLKGQELENFTLLYTPPLKIYRAKFNLPLYVDSCYKEFVKIPAEKRRSKAFLDLNDKP
jgi:hypothetical protein